MLYRWVLQNKLPKTVSVGFIYVKKNPFVGSLFCLRKTKYI